MPIVLFKKIKPLTPCVEPNREIQLDFAGSIYDGQNKETWIIVCVYRFCKYSTAIMVKKTLVLQTLNVSY